MADIRQRHPIIEYITLLTIGFLGLCLPNLLRLTWGNGLATAIWILSFLCLTDRFRSGRATLITCIVFLAGYYLKFLGAMDFKALYVLLFLVLGLIQFGIFFIYSRLIGRWNRFITTLAFPLLWMAVYLLATLVRFPTMIRVDMMFADMNVLMQLESLLGSFGFSSLLLWFFSLLSYAIGNRRLYPALIAAALYLTAMVFGVIYLYPNISESECVRVAFSTGPYVGDYLNYTSLPLERNLNSMQSCTAQAAEQGAEIIVFNEETYEIDDVQEEGFLGECCLAARENGIHMLVGLDLRDTDGSEGGKSINKVVWIDQKGEILGSYLKAKTIPVLEADYVQGDGKIPSHVISVGDKQIKISFLICYDSNFPLYVNRIANDTDILFLPSWDWPAVTAQHSMLCRTLAVDNRVSIVKPTYDGINIAVRPDGTVIHASDTNKVGYEQVQTVDVPIRQTTGSAALPERERYVDCIISVEIMSILICIILLYVNLYAGREKTSRNRLYSYEVVCCTFALAADAVSWIFDGCTRLESLLYVSTVLSFLMTFVMDGLFVYYIAAYIREKRPISYTLPRVYLVFTVIAAVTIVAISGSGLLFTFENGVYRDGPLYGVYAIINLLFTVFCLLINMFYMRSMSIRDRIASISFILFPFLDVFINLFFTTFSYAYPSIVLSLLVLYVMIQAERQDRLEEERFITFQRARHDVLTGLLNRLAYEERLQDLAVSGSKVGAVFTDMNRLKVTNDRFGHEAGDRVLVDYAATLCRYFRKEDVFRISGDEFTIILENMDESVIRARIETLRKDISADGLPLASIGLSYGNSRDISELIKSAETQMYVEKAEFHRSHPEFGRN